MPVPAAGSESAYYMQGKERRPFVQSFFLATQERGYFVLNDTFRYMEPQKEAYPADRAPGSVTSVNPYTNEVSAHCTEYCWKLLVKPCCK